MAEKPYINFINGGGNTAPSAELTREEKLRRIDEYFRQQKAEQEAQQKRAERIVNAQNSVVDAYTGASEAARDYSSGWTQNAAPVDEITRAQNTADTMKNYAELFSGEVDRTLGKGTASNLYGNADDVSGYLSDVRSGVRAQRDLYSQYENADDYNADQRLFSMSSDELKKEIDKTQSDIDAAKRNSKQDTANGGFLDTLVGMSAGGTGLARPAYRAAVPGSAGEASALENQLLKLNAIYNSKKYSEDVSKYGIDPSSMTYDQLMEARDNANGTKRTFIDDYINSVGESNMQTKRAVEWYASLPKDEKAKLDGIWENAQNSALAVIDRLMTGAHNATHFFKNQESDLIKTDAMRSELMKNGYSEEDADRIADLYSRRYNASQNAIEQARAKVRGDLHPVASQVSDAIGKVRNSAYNLGQPLGMWLGEYTSGKPVDVNNAVLRQDRAYETARNAAMNSSGWNSVESKAKDLFGDEAGARVTGWMKSAVSSGLDDLARNSTVGTVARVLGAEADVISKLVSVVASSNAALTEFRQNVESGKNTDEAFSRAALTGFIEFMTEMVGGEFVWNNILRTDSKGLMKIVTTVAKNALAEGTEEVMGNTAQRALNGLTADNLKATFESINNGNGVVKSFFDNTGWRQDVKAYTDQGLSLDSAMTRALGDWISEDVDAFMSAFLSAGISSGGTMAINRVNTNSSKKVIGDMVNSLTHDGLLKMVRNVEAKLKSGASDGKPYTKEAAADDVERVRGALVNARENIAQTMTGEESTADDRAFAEKEAEKINRAIGQVEELSSAIRNDRTADIPQIASSIEASIREETEREAEEARTKSKRERAISDFVRGLVYGGTRMAQIDQDLSAEIRRLDADAKSGVEGAQKKLDFANEALAYLRRHAAENMTRDGLESIGKSLDLLGHGKDRSITIQYDYTWNDDQRNASYNRETNTVTLNPYSPMTQNHVRFVLGHELLHALRADGERGQAIVDSAWNTIQSLMESGQIRRDDENYNMDVLTKLYAGDVRSYLSGEEGRAEVASYVNQGMTEEAARAKAAEQYLKEEAVANFFGDASFWGLDKNGNPVDRRTLMWSENDTEQQRREKAERVRNLSPLFDVNAVLSDLTQSKARRVLSDFVRTIRNFARSIVGAKPVEAKRFDTLADAYEAVLKRFDAKPINNTANTENASEAAQGAATEAGDAIGDDEGIERSSRSSGEDRFSLSKPVEETKTLVALHNLSEDKLEKAIALGGLPMPSIAVTRYDIPHTNFGPITLIFGKETIDPRADRRNDVYSADAWTPTFPSVEYEVNEKAASRLRSRYYELYRKFGNDATRPLYPWGNYPEDQLNRVGGSEGVNGVIRNAMDDPDMMKLFLLDSGKTVPEPVVREEVTRLDDETIKLYDHLIGALGEDAFRELIAKDGESPMQIRKRWWQAHGEAFNAAYSDYLRGLGFSDAEIENVINNESVASQTSKAVKIRNYLRDGAETRTTKEDYSATNDAIREATDKEAYSKWLHGLFDGLEKGRGLYNGKDRYTPSGNLRSFAATHIPYTLENIVKAMASENDGNSKNVSGFHGVKSLRASIAERFPSISAMHRAEGRLSNLTEEEADAINDALATRLSDVMNRIHEIKSDHGYNDFDYIGENLSEIAEQKTITTDSIKRILSGYGYNIDDALAEDIRALLFDISEMPVNIFEAKPKRVVQFDETAAAVVPDTTSDTLIDKLKAAGVPEVLTYKSGDDADRLAKVNSVDGVRFSRSTVTPEENARYMELAKDPVKNADELQRMVDEAARSSGFREKVYHGGADVTVFDTSRGRGGITQFGPGTYVTDSRYYASLWADERGGKVTNLYLKDGRYLEGDSEIRSSDEWEKLKSILKDRYGFTDKEIGIVKEWSLKRLIPLLQKHNGSESERGVFQNADDANSIIREAGYTGIQGELYDGKQWCVFNPEDIKSADPVTYDKNGNIIPLSERFNTEEEDIRYSRSAPSNVTESKQFKRWFGDSKIVNEDGTPKIVYHQTAADFWTFDNSRPVAGANDSETPSGYFFKDNDHDIGIGGNRQMAVYLRMTKPLHFTNRQEANAWYSKHIDGYDALQKEMESKIAPISKRLDEITDEMFADTNDERYEELKAEEDKLIDKMREVDVSYRGRLHALLNDYFLKGGSGYDGIILDDDGHSYVNGVREDVKTYIVFDNRQIKSATDNIGTFDGNNPDIRFSRSLTPEQRKLLDAERRVERLKEEKEFFRALTQKGRKAALSPRDADRIVREIQESFDVKDERIRAALGIVDKLYNKKLAGEERKNAEQTLKSTVESIVRDAYDAETEDGDTLAEWVQKAISDNVDGMISAMYAKYAKYGDSALPQQYMARIRQIEADAERDARAYQKRIADLESQARAKAMRGSATEKLDAARKNANYIRAAAEHPTEKKFVPQNARGAMRRLANWIDSITVRGGVLRVNGEEAERPSAPVRGDVSVIAEVYGAEYAELANALLNRIDQYAEYGSESEYKREVNAARSEWIAESTYKLSQLLRSAVANQNRVWLDGKRRDAETIGGDMIDALNERRGADERFTSVKDKTFGEKAKESASKLLYFWKTNPGLALTDAYTFLHRIGRRGDEVFDALRYAQETQTLRNQEFVDTMQTKLKGIDLSKYGDEKWDKYTVTFADARGREVTVPRSVAMSVAALWRRMQGREHLENGGFVYDRDGKRSDPIRVGEKSVKSIEDALTEDDKKVMGAMLSFMQDDCTRWGNEATMRRYGFERFTVDNYFRIDVDKFALPANTNKSFSGQPKIENTSFAKPTREGAGAPVVAGDFIRSVIHHVNGMATYSAYLNAEGMVNQILSTKGLRDTMQRVLGNGSVKYVEDLMTALKSQTRNEEDALEKLWSMGAAYYKTAAVAYNLSTALKQPISYTRAAAVMDTKYLTRGMKAVTSSEGRNRALGEMQEFSGTAVKKLNGYSDTGMARDTAMLIGAKKETVRQKIVEFGMRGAEFGDRITWEALWTACREETRDRNPDMTPPELMEATAKRFSSVVAQTQVTNSPLDTAPILRSNSVLTRNLFAFWNEPLKTYNLLMRAYDNIVQAKDGAAAKRAILAAARPVASVAAGMVLEAAVSALFRSLRDDRDDDMDDPETWKKLISLWGGEMVDNVFGVLPYVDQFAEVIRNAMNGYSNTDMGLEVITDILDAAKALADSDGEKAKTEFSRIRALAEAVATAFGIPAKNALRTLKTIGSTALNFGGNIKAQYNYQKIFYNPKNATAREKYGFADLLAKAYIEGDEEAYRYIRDDMIQMGISPASITKSLVKNAKPDDVDGSSSSLTAYKPGSDGWYLAMGAVYDRATGAPRGLEEEVTRLYEATGDSGVLPNFAPDSFTVNGEEVKIEGEAYTEFSENYAKRLYEVQTAIRNTAGYRAASDEQKAWWMEKSETVIGAILKHGIDPDYNVTSQGKWIADYLNASDADIAKYIVENTAKK